MEKTRKKTEMYQSLTLIKEYVNTHKYLLAIWRTSTGDEQHHLTHLIQSAEQAWEREMARLKRAANEVYK